MTLTLDDTDGFSEVEEAEGLVVLTDFLASPTPPSPFTLFTLLTLPAVLPAVLFLVVELTAATLDIVAEHVVAHVPVTCRTSSSKFFHKTNFVLGDTTKYLGVW